MKKIFTLLLSALMIFLLTACGDNSDKPAPPEEKNSSAEQPKNSPKPDGKKILVVYYSRAGDNYEVGVIEKGNTRIVADMIAEETGADKFEIQPVNAYPEDYEECTRVAKEELQQNARPQIVGKVENWSDYDTIFLGYPNWWSDMPMLIYTFLESYDWTGKTVIPFCTSSSESFIGGEEISESAKGSTVREGLGIRGKRCQDDPESVRRDVKTWLSKVNL